MKTPFDILDINEDASDKAIKKAYLQKVRQYPPERAPEQFQRIRAAFEAIMNRQQRLKYQLFHHEVPSFSTLLGRGLQIGKPQRPPKEVLIQALNQSLNNG
ncbi:MAG: molecular chaperone DnaJ [Gammaproteobacteria bacterium]|nr:MAG: molecular chaperone DnaJ [Gammaproteobacteria bacterium]RKZ76743.1 MAG: molecular chaperone DnaJ [Gammaproteobacteria bacterium]